MRDDTVLLAGPSAAGVREPATGERLCMDGICFDNIDASRALAEIRALWNHPASDGPHMVFFVNVHSLHVAKRQRRLREALRAAHLVLPDGSGLAIAGRMAGLPVSENLNGTDFTPKVIAEAERQGRSLYLVGGRPEVVSACRERLLERFPRLIICGADNGHFAPGEEERVLERIAAARPDIVLVGMGTPAQESWIVTNRRALRTNVCFAVGGLFDFLSGQKPRAPRWMRSVGMEWVYRFLMDPATKWDRVLVEIPVFLVRALFRLVPVHAAVRHHHERSRGGR